MQLHDNSIFHYYILTIMYFCIIIITLWLGLFLTLRYKYDIPYNFYYNCCKSVLALFLNKSLYNFFIRSMKIIIIMNDLLIPVE